MTPFKREGGEMVTIEEFKKIELQIAEIVSAVPHPGVDKLNEKTLVAGIRPYYREGELAGKKIVVVTNLAPAQIRGVTSEGMLLAASQGNSLTLLVPDREISSGAQVR